MVRPVADIGGVAESKPEAQSTNDATRPLMDFLQDGKNEAFFSKLYESEAVCLGLFRQVVMYLLWMLSAMKAKDLKLLLQLPPDAPHEDLNHAHPLLYHFLILQESIHKGMLFLSLHEGFKKGLRGALTGGGTSKAFGLTYKSVQGDNSIGTDIEELIEHGEQTWESLLKYMVSSRSHTAGDSQTPKQPVLDLLVNSELMGYVLDLRGRPTQQLQITSKGFQFLLEERTNQVWQILMYFIYQGMMNSGSGVRDGSEVLKLLFTLSSMQLGRAYNAASLPPGQAAILDQIEDFGLIYRRERLPNGNKHAQFYPTRLATTLCSGGSVAIDEEAVGSAGETRKGFLILETNYKIYAYTSNELEVAILNLFVDIRTRYPNLIVGRLERDTVKRAMEEGITANQIISYLTTHAHPQMHKNNPLLPITVIDQLHLWDRERNRLKKESAVMFKFFQKDLYDDCVTYANTIAALLHASSNPGDTSRTFVGRILVHDQMSGPFKDYVQSRREEIARY